jgi:hypothetical protein
MIGSKQKMDLQRELASQDYQFIVNWMIRLGITFHEIENDESVYLENRKLYPDLTNSLVISGVLEDLKIIVGLRKKYSNISDINQTINNESAEKYIIDSITCELRAKTNSILILEQDLKLLTPQFSLPETIGTLSQLRILILNGISLGNIPQSISKLKLLEEWHWIDGKIPEGNIDLSQLSLLRKIVFNSNELQIIPQWLFTIPNLEELNLEGNPLKYCPYNWPTWKNFKKLILDQESLDENYIPKTQFEDFPWTLGLLLKENPQLQIIGLPENWGFIQNYRMTYEDIIEESSWKRQAYINSAEILNPECFIPRIISKIQDNRALDEIDKAFPLWLNYFEYLFTKCNLSRTQTANEVRNILITCQTQRLNALHVI